MPTRSSSPSTSARATGRTSPSRPRVDVVGDPHVVAHGQRAERLEPLEGAAHPALGPPVHRRVGDVAAVEPDLAAGRLLQAADHVEAGRLAGAVRPDQPGDPAGLGHERRVVDGGDPAELDDDVVHDQERISAHGRAPPLARRRRGRSPVVGVRRREPPGKRRQVGPDRRRDPPLEPAAEPEELAGQAVGVPGQQDRADRDDHEEQPGHRGMARLEHGQQHQRDATQHRAGHRRDARRPRRRGAAEGC